MAGDTQQGTRGAACSGDRAVGFGCGGLNVLLLIDNYDSFTYNLAQYLGELGAEVNVYRNDALTLSEIEAWQPEQIVISPGPCTPNEAGICVPLIQRFAGQI